ncbi:hypothetical protein PCK2_000056, partial [Pneumocystis canis]
MVLGGRRWRLLVSWAGIDPATGKTYKPCWVSFWVRKSDCTEELLNTWIKNHKQRKTKKSLNISKKRLVEDTNKRKDKKRKVDDSYHDEKDSLNSSNEKKYRNMLQNKYDDSHTNCSSIEILSMQEMLDDFDSSLLSVEDSQNKSYIKPFLFSESSQNFSEMIHSDDSVPKKSEDSKNFNTTLETYHGSENLNNLASMNPDTQVKEEIMETAINDISMSRIFNFSEFPKKSLNIENDNDQDTFLENTVSSIYNITNDNPVESSNFHIDIFPKSDSIFIADNNMSNITSNKHEEHAHENDKTDIFKETDSKVENTLENTHYDNVSTNDSRELKSLPLSEKVSTWLSCTEPMQLGVFDDSYAQVSTSTINVEENHSNSADGDYPAMCISVESELLSGSEKDNISVKSKASYEEISVKYDSDVSTASTYDNFFVSLKSIQNKSHVYFFGIEMNKMQRDMYLQLILQYNGLIQEFCFSSQHDKMLIKKIQRERLQTRYEEMQEQYRDLKSKFESTMNMKDELQKRFNDLQEDFIHLKENRNLSSQIEKSKNIFPTSGQEGIATNALYDSEKAYFLEENLRLKKVIENKVSDFEFLRSQYQEASSSAANLADEVKQLEAENLRLKNKAEGEAVRLKEMMIQLLEKNMNERIEELEIQNSLYFEQLRQKIKNETTKQLY